MAIKNIIFDWSGVISNDKRTVYETTMIVFEQFNKKKISYNEFQKEFELPYMNFYRKYLNTPAEEVEKAYTEEVEKKKVPKIYPEAKHVLERLKNSGFYMTIFSSMTTKRLNDEIRHMGLNKYFSNPKSGIRDKVSAMSEFVATNGFRRDNTLYVADMVHDIHAAKKAGIRIAAITRGYDSREKLEREKPEYLIDNLNDLIKILEKENKVMIK